MMQPTRTGPSVNRHHDAGADTDVNDDDDVPEDAEDLPDDVRDGDIGESEPE